MIQKETQVARLYLTSKDISSDVISEKLASSLKDDVSEKHISIIMPPQYSSDVSTHKASCLKLGFREENIFFSDTGLPPFSDYFYVPGGNVFLILGHIQKRKLREYIRSSVAKGASYIGASAGAMLAGDDVKLGLDFDKNFKKITDFTGLGLFHGTILPHHTDSEKDGYLKAAKKERTEQYAKIYAVDEDSVLVLEASLKGEFI